MAHEPWYLADNWCHHRSYETIKMHSSLSSTESPFRLRLTESGMDAARDTQKGTMSYVTEGNSATMSRQTLHRPNENLNWCTEYQKIMTLVDCVATLVFIALRLILKKLSRTSRLNGKKGHSKSMSRLVPSIKHPTYLMIAFLVNRCCADEIT